MNATHSLKDIFDVKTFRDRYVVEHCGNKRPDSVKKYLSCYQNFCDYLVIEMIHVPGVNSSDILHMKIKVEAWKKTFKRASKARKQERNMEDFSMLVTPDQVKMYTNSENAVKARQHLKDLQEVDVLAFNQAEYCSLRDHLFCVIQFVNGHRSGVASNMMVEEFQAGEYS